jgi:hypothetical protein
MVLGVFLGACESKPDTAELSPKEMQKKLQEVLPKGMKLQQAREYMEREGFACEMIANGEWRKKKVPRFMHCKREDGQMIKRRWEVAVVHDGESIVSVDVRNALIYP